MSLRERVLPTGHAHIVFRLDGPPLRLFTSDADQCGTTIGHAIIGGPRERFYLRDVSVPTTSVGAQLWPGALPLLTGIPARELTGEHVSLNDLWPDAELVREQLHALSPAQRLDAFEVLLAKRLPVVRGLHPAISFALQALAHQTDVTRVVEKTGYSHRHFLDLFTHEVGLTPKRYARVTRFQAALRALNTGTPLAELSYAEGYGDQAHFAREFRSIAGLTPTDYRGAGAQNANHVPVTSKIDKTPGTKKGSLGA